ncbi:MAG: class B sortase [Lachnospiraceae bacterium]|nr:class B sortase [Lachnospiraceae bacterium]
MDRRPGTGAFLIMLLITGSVLASGCRSEEDTGTTDVVEAPVIAEDQAHKLSQISVVPKESEPELLPMEKYDEYLKINPYVSGWLRIDDTVIDAPVVYTPQDQNYFLHKALDGTDESKGTFFIANNWGDVMNQTLIYGHNMKDGTAFGSLLKFADESYGRKHHVLHFDTLYEEREYELYGVFYSQIDVEDLETDEDRAEREQAVEDKTMARLSREGEEVSEEDLTLEDLELYGVSAGDLDIYRQEKDEDNGRFRYYFYTDLRKKDDFFYFADSVKERALYDMGIEAEWGDEFLTLSTCSYQVKNGRFVVVGIRKAAE